MANTARIELIKLARDYTREYRDVAGDTAQDHAAQDDAAQDDAAQDADRALILLTGHQPRLFHPGVWYKNFALARLARLLDAVAIHLIIDNDMAGAANIQVPTGSVDRPRLESIALDVSMEDVPIEERPILDARQFASFGRRAAQCVLPFVPDPLIRDWWPAAVESSRRVRNLGWALAQARHQLEASWGLDTWELPLSRVCETHSFRQFLVSLLAELPRFLDTYNGSLLEYRRVHRIRSHSHPVPRLERRGEWLEAPCWIWTTDEPRRKRLFVRCTAKGMELTDYEDLRFAVGSPASGDGESAVQGLADLAARGVKVRPRALLTTMYARLMLSDLFLHGIGGGKYDQLTDAIARRFFGVEPPGFLVLSATARLPMELPAASDDERRRLDKMLRELQYNPDRHVAHTEETSPLIAAKQFWVASQFPKGSNVARHEGIVRANAALSSHVAGLRARLHGEREELLIRLRHNRLLASRDFAFCLFPASALQALLLDKP